MLKHYQHVRAFSCLNCCMLIVRDSAKPRARRTHSNDIKYSLHDACLHTLLFDTASKISFLEEVYFITKCCPSLKTSFNWKGLILTNLKEMCTYIYGTYYDIYHCRICPTTKFMPPECNIGCKRNSWCK